MTEEEAKVIVHYIARACDTFAHARAGYRVTKNLRKSTDLDAMAQDYALWRNGFPVDRIYRASQRSRIDAMMHALDDIITEGVICHDHRMEAQND